MNESKLLTRYIHVVRHIELLINDLELLLSDRNFPKMATVMKKGETDLIKVKMLLSGLKKEELTSDEKEKVKTVVMELQKKINTLSLRSETNAVFYSNFINILNTLMSTNYNKDGKKPGAESHGRFSHQV